MVVNDISSVSEINMVRFNIYIFNLFAKQKTLFTKYEMKNIESKRGIASKWPLEQFVNREETQWSN